MFFRTCATFFWGAGCNDHCHWFRFIVWIFIIKTQLFAIVGPNLPEMFKTSSTLFHFCFVSDSSPVIGLLAHLYVSLLLFYLIPFIKIYYGLVPQSSKKWYMSTNFSDFMGALPWCWHHQWPSGPQALQFMQHFGFAGNFFGLLFFKKGFSYSISALVHLFLITASPGCWPTFVGLVAWCSAGGFVSAMRYWKRQVVECQTWMNTCQSLNDSWSRQSPISHKLLTMSASTWQQHNPHQLMCQ